MPSLLNSETDTTGSPNDITELLTGLNKFADAIHGNAIEKGFWKEMDYADYIYLHGKEHKSLQDAVISQKISLIHSELGEATEALRSPAGRVSETDLILYAGMADEKDLSEYAKNESFEKHIKDSFEDEMADTIIRILDLCAALDIDIEFHIKEKFKYNLGREKLHGKEF